jgi:hypothetical protein
MEHGELVECPSCWGVGVPAGAVDLSGAEGDDAEHYQEKQIAAAVAAAREAERRQKP